MPSFYYVRNLMMDLLQTGKTKDAIQNFFIALLLLLILPLLLKFP